MKTPKMVTKAFALGLTSCFLTSFASAQLIYQPFADADGTAFTSAAPVPGITSYGGTGANIATTSALSYPGLVSSGNGYGPLNGRSWMVIDLTPASPLASYIANGLVGGTGTGTLYISWMIKGANSGSANLLDLRRGGVETTGFGTLFSGGGYRLIASPDGTNVGQSYQNSNINPSPTTADFLVAKITYGPGNTDKIELFINQTTEGTPNVATGSNRNAKFDQISFGNFGGALGFYDELRVGATFADVAPVSAVPAPIAPSALQATVESFSEITLDWTDNSSNELTFTVERSLDGTTGWTPVGTTGIDITSFQDIGLTAATQYYYRVFATNSGGISAFSSVVSATTSALPALVPLTTVTIPFADADGTPAASAAPDTGVLAFAGTGQIQTSSALVYPGVPSSGNGFTAASGRFFMTLDTTLPGLERYMSGGRIGGSGLGVIYVSWMARGINGNEANTVEFRSGNDDNQSIVSVGTTFGDQPNIRLLTGNTLTGGTQNYITTTHAASPATDFFVVKFTFGLDNTSTVDLFINQTSEGTPDASSICFAQFNTIGFTKFGGAPNPSVDEFRMGTSFQAVTGNSASSGLVAFRANNSLAPNGDGDLLTPANDGVTNLLKYAFNMIGGGTGQTASLNTSNVAIVAADGSAGLPRQGLNAGALTLTYIRRAAASNSGVTYVVKFSSDLMSFAANPAATEIVVDLGGGLERVTVTDSVVAPGKRFARVEVIAN